MLSFPSRKPVRWPARPILAQSAIPSLEGLLALSSAAVNLFELEISLPGVAVAERLAESKRLFFVALSRATSNLLLTFPHNRGGKGSLRFDAPGRGEARPFIRAASLAASYHT